MFAKIFSCRNLPTMTNQTKKNLRSNTWCQKRWLNSPLTIMGGQYGGERMEPGLLRQTNFIVDYVNKCKRLVKLQITGAELVIRNNMQFSCTKIFPHLLPKRYRAQTVGTQLLGTNHSAFAWKCKVSLENLGKNVVGPCIYLLPVYWKPDIV